MNKLSSLLAAALVATCVFATVAALAAPPTKVETDVSINFAKGSGSAYDQYAEATFHGKVRAKHGCKVKRKVLIKKQGGGTVGSDKTDAKGFYETGVGNKFDQGNYFASVKKRTVKDDGEKFKCKKALSETINAS